MQEINKIKAYRQTINYSQEKMAKELKISIRCYQTKEHDVNKFKLSELKQIVEILAKNNIDVKIEDLV